MLGNIALILSFCSSSLRLFADTSFPRRCSSVTFQSSRSTLSVSTSRLRGSCAPVKRSTTWITSSLVFCLATSDSAAWRQFSSSTILSSADTPARRARILPREAGNEVTVTSFEGLTLYPRLALLPGQELVDILEDPEEEELQPTGIVDNIVSR